MVKNTDGDPRRPGGPMKEKNRFSGLLKHLMTVAKLKNYTLAKELQYDESYISKWVNGNLLPTEKTSAKTLREISRCVVAALDDESRDALYSEYQVDHDMDLEAAIYDNLEAEFNYVMDLKETTGSEIALKTAYYPELTLAQFMQKMRHPVLRQVKSLDVLTAVDILSLDRNYQMAMAELENSQNVNVTQRSYPGVHFSMLINLDNTNPAKNTYNIQFLLNLLTNLSNVDLQLYSCPQTVGKIIFTVKDAYSISGMVMDKNHCMCVSTSEEPKNCNAIYDRLKSLCSQETLAVRRTVMPDMLRGNEYVQYLFARNQRWLMGHVTEHFLPDDLYETLADEYCATHKGVDRDSLTRIHMLNKSILESMDIQLLAYENTMSDFAVTGILDFYNSKVQLTPEQRLRCMEYTAKIPEKNPKLRFRILRNGTISDLQHIPNSTLFLSDSFCYMRLIRQGPVNNLSVINKVQVCDLFRKFFDDIWENESYVDPRPESAEDQLYYAAQLVKVQIQIK